MKIPGLVLTLALLAVRLAWGQDAPRLPCADNDQQCAEQALKTHVAGQIGTWRPALSLPLDERIGPAPPQLVEYINLDNIANGYPERPRAAALDAGLLADVKASVAGVPRDIWRLVGNRLAGLYFVDGLGGTGYTDYIIDEHGQPVAAFVVFDAAILGRQRANAWATWKENTPFTADPRYRLAARIEADGDDNRINAIQYILLHELGHVLSVGTDIHPPWNIEPRQVEAGARYPFFELSWKVEPATNKYLSVFDPDFPRRADIVYYFGAKLSAADMAPTYAMLAKTNFPSLYAATKPGDDFAESFASYVHVVLMHRPWQIRLSRGGRTVRVLKACWDQARCAGKRKALERILGRAA